ncbi:MAG: flagellar basal-body MS-ring/collar protein FliF [Pseudomonadota bacterium]
MDSISAFWNGQDKRRLAILGLATVAAFVAVLFLTRLATAPRMELLYANLDPAVAGEVVASLEGRGVVHDVRGGSIYVDGALRDALRLQLAGEGLPRDDGRGYELLDGLSGFGTTSQMFDAAYWRAREGELTRTILSGTGVKLARVHLATADASPFARDRSATASVTLQMVSGAVDVSFARAVQSLVAGAVRDLSPEDVTIIDSNTGRVVGSEAVDSEAERRDNRIAEMRAAVENILAARVGPGRYVVELALETTTARETITERVLDPDSRVVISTDTEERSANDRGSASGVTVASNLPDGEASGGDQESQSAETRERVNYDFSATQRQIERGPGAIERVTVAVLVDGLRGEETGVEDDWVPRPEPELDVLRDLVSSAVGFKEARGDVVTVRTMQFGDLPGIEALPGLSLPWFSGAQIAQMVTAALLAVVALVAILAGLRTLRARAPLPPILPEAPALTSGQTDGHPAALEAPQSEPELEMSNAMPALPSDTSDLPDLSDLGALTMSGRPDGQAADDDDPVERLRQLISDRRDETIEVLRGWVEDVPEDAR